MKKIVTLLAMSLPLFALAGGGCNNLYTRISPDGQYMYFSSDRHAVGTNYEIYRSRLDGWSDLERLTTGTANNLFASISPDGGKVVFQSGDYGGGSEIWIMNSDGTGLTQLTFNNVHDGYPNFSPDGQKIVFEAWDTDQYPEIFTMDVNGNNRTQLTNVAGAYWQSNPIYNPSGTYIYFSLGYNADNHIARMNLDGTNWVDITAPNSFGYADFYPQFSPDGQHLVFETTEYVGYNNGSDIIIADTTGANWNRITNSAGGEYFYHTAWHPTNNKLYYSYNPGAFGQWQIYEMTQAGTGALQLTDCSGVGTEETAAVNTELSVYPNPASELLNIIGVDGNVNVELYDAGGRLVLSATGTRVDVSKLEPGFYSVMIRDTDFSLLGQSRVVKE